MKKQLIVGVLSILFVNLTYAASVCLSHASPNGAIHKNAPGEAINNTPPHHPPRMHQAPGEADKTMESVNTVPMGNRTNDPLRSSGPSLQINGH